MFLFYTTHAQNMQNADLQSTPHFSGYLQKTATGARQKIIWYPSVNGYRPCGAMVPLKPIPAGYRHLDVDCHCIEDNDNGRVMSGNDIGPIQFDANTAKLNTASYQRLKFYASLLLDDEKVHIVLNGHASSEEGSGTAAHGLKLGTDRAKAVKAYLINLGVDAKQITIKSYGEIQPVASNATEEGRILNRRVEITLQK